MIALLWFFITVRVPTVDSVLHGATKNYVDAPLHERKEIEQVIQKELSFVAPPDAEVVLRLPGEADREVTSVTPTSKVANRAVAGSPLYSTFRLIGSLGAVVFRSGDPKGGVPIFDGLASPFTSGQIAKAFVRTYRHVNR